MYCHDLCAAELFNADLDTKRRRGLVGDEGHNPLAMRRIAMSGWGTDDIPVVTDADEEPSTIAVGKANDGLNEFVVVCVALEFDGVCLSCCDNFL